MYTDNGQTDDPLHKINRKDVTYSAGKACIYEISGVNSSEALHHCQRVCRGTTQLPKDNAQCGVKIYYMLLEEGIDYLWRHNACQNAYPHPHSASLVSYILHTLSQVTFATCQRSCGKVIFSLACFFSGGRCAWSQVPLRVYVRYFPDRYNPLGR